VLPRGLRSGIVAGALWAALAGCGGSSDKPAQPRPPASAEQPPPRLSTGNRATFVALARNSGVLRAAAVPVAYGSATRIVVQRRLRAAARQVGRTHPRNAALRALRARLLAALHRAASAETLQDSAAKRIARDSIAATDRVDAGLRRYAASNPAANELLPGSSG
jgi:hypothetical protein